jgi:hypothetical protein
MLPAVNLRRGRARHRQSIKTSTHAQKRRSNMSWWTFVCFFRVVTKPAEQTSHYSWPGQQHGTGTGRFESRSILRNGERVKGRRFEFQSYDRLVALPCSVLKAADEFTKVGAIHGKQCKLSTRYEGQRCGRQIPSALPPAPPPPPFPPVCRARRCQSKADRAEATHLPLTAVRLAART